MKKAMISQPMNGLSEESIVLTRQRAINFLERKGYEVVNTFFNDEWYEEKAMEERGVVNRPMCFFAKSVENMSKCDAVYFCNGWDRARGCRLEHLIAQSYGVKIMHEGAEREDLPFPDIRLYARPCDSGDIIKLGWEFDYKGKPYGDFIIMERSKQITGKELGLLCTMAEHCVKALNEKEGLFASE